MTGGGGRSASEHYDLLHSLPEIRRTILESGYWNVANDAHLWCWSVNNYLEWGLALMTSLDFRYVTNLAWGKCSGVSPSYILTLAGLDGMIGINERRRDLQDLTQALWKKQPAGIGHYLRGQHELLLFGVRGKFIGLEPAESLLLAPRTREHSEKPEASYEVIEQVSPGPRLEMFARKRREGWTSWGREIPQE